MALTAAAQVATSPCLPPLQANGRVSVRCILLPESLVPNGLRSWALRTGDDVQL